jgi:shikimate kinase
MPRVTLIGYRGTGKSTVAAILAARLGLPWLDADTVLEERVGGPIADLVERRGEAAFRDVEAAVLRDLLPGFAGVLATGGGVVLRPENRLLLRESGRPVVWLTAPPDVIRRRLAADPHTPSRRPGLLGGDPLAEVDMALVARAPLYQATADVAFDTAREPPESLATMILEWLGRSDAGGPA